MSDEMTPEERAITTGIPPRKTNFEIWCDKILTPQLFARIISKQAECCEKTCPLYDFCNDYCDDEGDVACMEVAYIWANMEAKHATTD